MISKVRYEAKGVVLGNLWGGGEASYPSETVKADTEIELMQTLNDMLKSGALDSGMGFDGLIGAYMMKCKIETFIYNGKPYDGRHYEELFLGDLREDQKDFLKRSINFVL